MYKHTVPIELSLVREQYQKKHLYEEQVILNQVERIVAQYNGLPNSFKLYYLTNSAIHVAKVLSDIGIPHVRMIQLFSNGIIQVIITKV